MPASADPSVRPSILVVDDTPANLQVLTGMLRDSGYRPRPVLSGRLALQAAEADPPDLVLLDLCMPEMDGLEVCRRFKADPRLKEIPVLFISALADTSDKLHAFAVGGVDYVTKPFQFAEVDARVKTHLELSRLQRERLAQNARLEELVRLRTRELEQAHARLAVLDKDKSDFLTLISHELRTPLHGLFGVTDLLFLEVPRTPAIEEYVSMFDQARHRLLSLLDDALLLTELKIEGGGPAATVPDLAPVLARARVQLAPFAAERRVVLSEVPATLGAVVADEGLLERALASLLATAVRFGEAATSVALSAGAVEPWLELRIIASGKEIPPALLPRFFEVLAINEGMVPGADLGLAPAVAERIISGFGGEVTIENLVPPGIQLTVRLRRPVGGLEPVEALAR